MNNIGILFSDFGPYHVARIEALADALKTNESKLFAFRFYESSTVYGWAPVTPANATTITLAKAHAQGMSGAIKLARALGKSIRKEKVKTVFLPSYAPLPNTLCIFSAKLAGCKIIMMNDSWRHTERTSFFGRLIKRFLIGQFSSSLVAGTPQKQFATEYGQNPAKVFLGYDVVDINYYSAQAEKWKAMPGNQLPVAYLPKRYFLNLGRFVSKKNIPVLINAYANLAKRYPRLDIALVLVGDGEDKEALKKMVTDLQLPLRDGTTTDKNTDQPSTAEVVFYPFQQVDKTPLFFARCEAFILPSMYEEWGLVVNEAMSCSSPVVVSENVGCVTDLVMDDLNGFHFNPASAEQLEAIMEKFVLDPTLANRLGSAGRSLIENWGPGRFAEGAINAIAATAS